MPDRYLTPSQRDMAAQKLEELGWGGLRKKTPKGVFPMTRKQIAAKTGASTKGMDRAARIRREGIPEVIKAVEEGKIKLSTAEKIVVLSEEEQKKIISAGSHEEIFKQISICSGKTALYRHYDKKGVLLYVGISSDPWTRFKSHSVMSKWILTADRFTGQWYESRKIAKEAETLAIKTEHPVFNISENPERRS